MASLRYSGLSPQSAKTWFEISCSEGIPRDVRTPRLTPNAAQRKIIDRIVQRCLEKQKDESSDTYFCSEPLRALLHGVPGAGKSEVLYWIRDFFEEVCRWTHGIEFVYLASQNSMAAVINGQTARSFCNVPFMNASGSTVNTRAQLGDHQNMSSLFLRYERLRWISMDEPPTLGCEVLAIANDNVRNNIRDENTWAMRNARDKRPWGGVNLGCTGDFWQFRPVQLTAVFDDPSKTYKSSSTERILAMFWTREPDAIQELFDLTEENRCQDKWLSVCS